MVIPILSSEQIRSADEHTITNEPIPSIDLMERASEAFTEKFYELVGQPKKVAVFAGVGNNGGDGLVVARLLQGKGIDVIVFVIGKVDKGTQDFRANLDKLPIDPFFLTVDSEFPIIDIDSIVIDAIFGSGLARPVTGLYADLIDLINDSGAKIISIDIASGLFADQAPEHEGAIIKPDHTITFQVPKLSFFQPNLHEFVGDWHVVPIGIHKEFIDGLPTDHHFTEKDDIISRLVTKSKFDHKGSNGKIQLVTGSKGKIGAASMSAKAAMRTGTGLLLVQIPKCGSSVIHNNVLEAMVIEDDDEEVLTEIKLEEGLTAIGIGPGIGTASETINATRSFLNNRKIDVPLILDADAINILSDDKKLLEVLPEGTILTPHPGEFKRLVGSWSDDFEKLNMLQNFCRQYKLNVVLKGAFSVVCDTEGKVFFNSTGNPGMATGGSGDVLFGMITSLAGQGMKPFDALLVGVYLHGLAGDVAKEQFGTRGMIATDIIEAIPETYLKLSV